MEDDPLKTQIEQSLGVNPVGEAEVQGRRMYGDARYDHLIKIGDDSTMAHTKLVSGKAFF